MIKFSLCIPDGPTRAIACRVGLATRRDAQAIVDRQVRDLRKIEGYARAYLERAIVEGDHELGERVHYTDFDLYRGSGGGV